MFVCSECGRSFQASGFCTEDGGALMSAANDPLLGQMVGDFRLAALVGKGGMGAVYKAVHPAIGSRVAIKFLSQECASSPALVERFFAEARAVNQIRHDNIVSVTNLAALPNGQPYIVMEFLDGAPLSTFIRQYRALPLGTLCRLIIEVLDALGAAHAKEIVHRDLKPDNLFVLKSGRVKVVDFGIAKLRPEMGGISDATRTGSLLGTPQYMSPEQAQGQHVDHRSDLYSVGVILFEAATGQRPFPAQTLYELLKAHVELMPPAPRLLRPDIPPQLENVLLHALQKDLPYRYQSAQDFRVALEHALQALPAETFTPLGDLSAAPRVPMAPTAPSLSTHSPQAAYPSPYPATYGQAYTPALGSGPMASPTPFPMHTPQPMAPYPPQFVAEPPAIDRGHNWVWIVVGCVALVVIATFLSMCGGCLSALSN
jgi:serine/threonine-protein kinase